MYMRIFASSVTQKIPIKRNAENTLLGHPLVLSDNIQKPVKYSGTSRIFPGLAMYQYWSHDLMLMSSMSIAQNALMKAVASLALVMSGILKSIAARRII